jgi:hypothetical protein
MESGCDLPTGYFEGQLLIIKSQHHTLAFVSFFSAANASLNSALCSNTKILLSNNSHHSSIDELSKIVLSSNFDTLVLAAP